MEDNGNQYGADLEGDIQLFVWTQNKKTMLERLEKYSEICFIRRRYGMYVWGHTDVVLLEGGPSAGPQQGGGEGQMCTLGLCSCHSYSSQLIVSVSL